jgi:hydrogenase-4 component B
MNTLFLALGLILAGGILPLLLYRQFTLAKIVSILLTVSGCGLGLVFLALVDETPATMAFSLTWLQTFPLSVAIDPLSIFFLVPIFLICPLATIYNFDYQDHADRPLKTAVGQFFLNLLLVAMVLVVVAHNLVTLLLAWEVMTLSSFFLVLHDFEKETTRKAGYLYLVFSQAGVLLIIAAFALIYSFSGSFLFDQAATVPADIKLLVFFLAFAGFGSKAGVFPLHIWLPHAHPAAPSHISAVLSGVMIKMGIYGVVRTYLMLGSQEIVIGQVVLILGMASGVLGVLYALGKHDIKRLLAYHSVENIGIILIGIGLGMLGVTLGNPVMAGFGFAGGLLHVLNHSLFKSLLFMGAGAVVKRTGRHHVDELGGLIKRMPITGKTFIAGSVSISGLPPGNGFISEFLIYFAAFSGLSSTGATLILVMLAIISLAVIGGLAAACFTKVIGIVFLGEPRHEELRAVAEAGRWMTGPMVLLAGFCLVIGVFPEPFIAAVFRTVAGLSLPLVMDQSLTTTVGANLALAARLFLLILLLVMAARKIFSLRKEIARGPTWGCGFTRPTVRMQYTGTSYAMSIISFYRPFARIRTTWSGIDTIFPKQAAYASRVDDIAEIALWKFLIFPLAWLLGKLRWIQHGQIQLYIGYIIGTIALLLLLLFL